ncbi:hypothetical protein EV356DRAFT_501066 [Viridothelium virens]|uniref:Uncharacterized protein n=1 Tax=Viridothelium virens TaxID=1048519 RepID=A0A6A6H9Y3_VIRVR|nr:hypothetical protein EV356DRAFT_501066 [Viridothelium virens]
MPAARVCKSNERRGLEIALSSGSFLHLSSNLYAVRRWRFLREYEGDRTELLSPAADKVDGARTSTLRPGEVRNTTAHRITEHQQRDKASVPRVFTRAPDSFWFQHSIAVRALTIHSPPHHRKTSISTLFAQTWLATHCRAGHLSFRRRHELSVIISLHSSSHLAIDAS